MRMDDFTLSGLQNYVCSYIQFIVGGSQNLIENFVYF